jgi:prolyl-tRNA synthetase
MLMSKLLGERYKEKPIDANLESHILLLRGGYVRQVANGIFSMLTPAKRVAMKIEKIVREEMESVEGQEVLLPIMMPSELWEETGRYDSVGSELFRLKDRNNHKMVLGMTHEEAAVHLARSEARSYSKYPFMIYQIQTKFRDEPRSRGGLIRLKEFIMKDAYSFHTSEEDLEQYYYKVHDAYERVYKRIGFKDVISVGSDSGMMGGNVAHEFMYLSESGEDTLVLCNICGYKANMEVATSNLTLNNIHSEKMEEVHTPNTKDIKALSNLFQVKNSNFVKAILFTIDDSSKILIVFIRGDLEVNEAKVKKVINKNISPFADYSNVDLAYGYIGPYKLELENSYVIYDSSLKGEILIGGANKKDYHIKGLNMDDIIGDNFVDIRKVADGHLCSVCNNSLTTNRGIEVGNIFQLGTKYSKSMQMTYVDVDGDKKTPLMGCYGIGISRTLACIVEQNHDERGIIWPISVAPWQIQICMLNTNIEEVLKTGMELYDLLKSKYEVICDDRNLTAGVQFAEADLLGIPIRIVVSGRNLEKNEIEITSRDKTTNIRVQKENVKMEIDKVVASLQMLL